MKSKKSIPDWVWVGLIVALAGALKLIILLLGVVPFNADESIVALMARHILRGELPIFFYGQAYMGSMDAWLVAGGFRIFGEEVWVIRLVQSLLYAGTILTTFWIGQVIFHNRYAGYIAALLLAIPTVNLTLYTTVSLGGYGEALLLGNIVLLMGLKIGRRLKLSRPPSLFLWLLLGFVSGLGFWSFGLTLVYIAPIFLYLMLILFRHRQPGITLRGFWNYWVAPLLVLLAGLFLGSFPWWIFAAEHGLQQLFWELRGGAIAGVEGLPFLGQFVQHLFNLIVFGIPVIFGLRPPWAIQWLGLPLAPFALATWLAVLLWIVRSLRQKDEQASEKFILVGIMLALVLAFVASPFGADPSGRYFLPFAIPLALFAGDLISWLASRFGRIAWAAALIILVFNTWGTIESVLKFPPGLTTQFDSTTQIDHRRIGELMSFLKELGENRGYTNYWVAYPLAFLSGEELIFLPLLPTHNDFRYSLRDDRYQPYDIQVASSARTAYITANESVLDQYLREKFTALNINWEETQIGDYHVFYDLSVRVEPTEIGLGINNP
jgi:4-amino-4-deoxy-L-arabinose transferase-like glycosyltransferase